MIYTGSLVYSFKHKLVKLPYRSIRFEWKNLKMDRFQKVAVVYYVGKEKYTRITVYKQLTGQMVKSTSISQEYPTFNGEPYYPISNSESSQMTRVYLEEAKKLGKIQFIGRLAENKYYNMDGLVAKVLNEFK